MRLNEGVEWALHSCLLMAWVGDQQPVPTAKLAAAFELPPAYLNKQLQALARAGIVTSTPGPKGGFQLARQPQEITLMDVLSAIEGPEDAFRCQEIRQRGVGASASEASFAEPCVIAAAMRTAELAWRRALSAQTLADIRADTDRSAPQAAEMMRGWYATH